jgi:hypothetical protein
MRLILLPAFKACCCQCPKSANNLFSLASNFFNGWRSIPGTIPATSQDFKLSSTTATSVASCSKVVGDFLLRSIGSNMGELHRLVFYGGGPKSPPPAP